MSLESATSLLDPLLVVPQLPCFGPVPSPVGREDSFHFEFGKALHDVAHRPHQWIVIVGFAEVIWLQEPIELKVTVGVIF